jgi:hypothetical protein
LAQQLGAGLEGFPRPTTPLGLLAEDLPGVTEAERTRSGAERRRGDPRDAGREVIAERQNATVAVGETDQPVGHLRSAGAEEHLLILKGRREQLLVARALEDVGGDALKSPSAEGGRPGQIECAGRDGSDVPGHGGGNLQQSAVSCQLSAGGYRLSATG